MGKKTSSFRIDPVAIEIEDRRSAHIVGMYASVDSSASARSYLGSIRKPRHRR
jgi:hypothetical protein